MTGFEVALVLAFLLGLGWGIVVALVAIALFVLVVVRSSYLLPRGRAGARVVQ